MAASDTVNAAKALELGLATGFGAIGPGVGVGFIFGKTIEAIGRQPELRGQLMVPMFLSAAAKPSLIDINFGLMFWTLVTFVLVLVILRWKAFGPLQEMIDA